LFQIQYGQNNEGTWWIAGLKQKDDIGDVWQNWLFTKVFGSCLFGKIWREDRQDQTRIGNVWNAEDCDFLMWRDFCTVKKGLLGSRGRAAAGVAGQESRASGG
jgi:hypothetical protein